MELDEWFGNETNDYNVTISEGVLTVTRYPVWDGQTRTWQGGTKLLEWHIS